ncbi:DUF6011 domain-containing protein [Nonomuraea sp. NPDC059194]|uniref:DUF6011 domain-containing protein n=1 Tax=Nonomuraea sp. NPDC059194 TaxID=3346764 RepID=UPI0036CF97B0
MTLLSELDEPTVGESPTVGRCRCCKHTLRTPESRALGLGPDCASKLGLAPRKPLRITGVPQGWDCDGQIDLLEETHD